MDTSSLVITPTTLLVFVTVVSAIGLLLGWISGSSKKEKDASDFDDVSRWRVFRVSPSVLHKGGFDKKAVVVEDPEGTRLLARPFHGKWEIAGDGKRHGEGDMHVEISRRGLLTARFHARLDGREWLSVRKFEGKHSHPEIRYRKASKSLQVAGTPLERDYEIRRGEKLVAMVTNRPPSPASDVTDHYTLEILKSEDPKPVLALVMCMEAAMPARRSRA